MKQKQVFTGIAAAAGMLILILDGKTALAGASEGITLCLKTVIPSLFPFFVLSILVTSIFVEISISPLRLLRFLCRLPAGSESIILSGFLGGYPVGAQCIAQSWKAGALRKQDAERMLGFCSNAGPAFLFGMIAPLFSHHWMVWALWCIHIASAILVSRFLPATNANSAATQKANMTLPRALHQALRVMATVCGWIILFRILLAFLNRWILWILPSPLMVTLTGILELSNGCMELVKIQDETLRFMICSGTLAFGGLCVCMQTAAVTEGLSLRYYYVGKLLQTLFSLCFSFLLIHQMWTVFLTVFLLLLFLTGKKQNKASIQDCVGV